MNSDEITQPIAPTHHCEKCGAYTQHGARYEAHSPDCTEMPLDTARGEVLRYHAAWLKAVHQDRDWLHKNTKHAQHEMIRARERAVMWQGKFQIVKTENNALRRKLAKGK